MDALIIIKNEQGATIYYFENIGGRRITFNLPVGSFTTFNRIGRLKRPLKYVCPALPSKEKFTKARPVNIEFADNPNKATIIKHPLKKDARIILDNQFKLLPTYTAFLLGHELGHFLYFSEWKCDVYSINSMLENGYNPSQCVYSEMLCLSNGKKNEGRKQKVLEYIKKIKCYE